MFPFFQCLKNKGNDDIKLLQERCQSGVFNVSRKEAHNMLLYKLCSTDRKLYFSYHTVYYLERKSYCRKSQRERNRWKIKEIKVILKFTFLIY